MHIQQLTKNIGASTQLLCAYREAEKHPSCGSMNVTSECVYKQYTIFSIDIWCALAVPGGLICVVGLPLRAYLVFFKGATKSGP